MRILGSFKVLILLITCLLVISASGWSQKIPKTNSNRVLPTHLQHVSDYFNKHPIGTNKDSIYQDAFTYLLNFSGDEVLKEKVILVQQYIDDNKAYKQLMNLFAFKRTVDSLNQVRSKFMSNYWQFKEMQKNQDSISVSLNDSVFSNQMDTLNYRDPLKMDSVFEALSPYTDSLSRSIDQNIAFFSQNVVFQWIKEMRHDTTDFYIINLEGDSLKIHLFDNSPEMIRFSISDYWGTKIKAVIRDIDKNSMKILIDKTPALKYETNEKAKKAFGSMGGNFDTDKNLTVTLLPIEKSIIHWILGGNTNIDLSQIHFSESWVKGGESSISMMTGLELFALYKNGNYSWESKGVFKYGTIRQGKSNYFKPTEDRIELGTKFGYNLFGNYFISLLSTFKSQFSSGYEYPTDTTRKLVSKFMSPGYVTFALGLDFKPNMQTTLFISPLTSKTTMVSSREIDQTKYGLDSTQQVRHETGAIIKATYKRKVWGNIEVENYAELFSNYFDHPQNIDVDWEFKLIFPVNDFIRSTISTRIIYDDNQLVPKYKDDASGNRIPDGTTKAIQFKELLTIGFAMKF